MEWWVVLCVKIVGQDNSLCLRSIEDSSPSIRTQLQDPSKKRRKTWQELGVKHETKLVQWTFVVCPRQKSNHAISWTKSAWETLLLSAFISNKESSLLLPFVWVLSYPQKMMDDFIAGLWPDTSLRCGHSKSLPKNIVVNLECLKTKYQGSALSKQHQSGFTRKSSLEKQALF